MKRQATASPAMQQALNRLDCGAARFREEMAYRLNQESRHANEKEVFGLVLDRLDLLPVWR